MLPNFPRTHLPMHQVLRCHIDLCSAAYQRSKLEAIMDDDVQAALERGDIIVMVLPHFA